MAQCLSPAEQKPGFQFAEEFLPLLNHYGYMVDGRPSRTNAPDDVAVTPPDGDDLHLTEFWRWGSAYGDPAKFLVK